MITTMQHRMTILAVTIGTGPDPSGSNVPGGNRYACTRKTAQAKTTRADTPISV
jgi:hypothetical protein